MDRLKKIHRELLQSVGAAHEKLGDKLELTTFFPMRAKLVPDKGGELMVVGRAVNHWMDQPWTAKEAEGTQRREEIIQEVFKWSEIRDSSAITESCPFQRLFEAWKKCLYCGSMPTGTCQSPKSPNSKHKKAYNHKRSAFFRVIRQVAQSILPTGCELWSQLIWSDLYKVAPFYGGNPNKILQEAQLKDCLSHLNEELQLWRPKRILFLTGTNWAQPFLEHLHAVGQSKNGCVQWSGNINLPDTQAKVVVGVHPQGKKEGPIIQEIIQEFASATSVSSK
jgi:hypothetical protein